MSKDLNRNVANSKRFIHYLPIYGCERPNDQPGLSRATSNHNYRMIANKRQHLFFVMQFFHQHNMQTVPSHRNSENAVPVSDIFKYTPI